MAKILSFRTPEFRAADDPHPRHSDSAEIILFPGVRYERWGEDAAPATTATAREAHRSRDVLELAE